MKHYTTILAIATLMMLCACTANSFRIEGLVENLGTQNVQIIYATSDGVQSDWISATDSRINYEGYAPELTVVNVLNSQGQQIARMAVKNGDKVQFRGTSGDPLNMEYKGNKTTEQWNNFIRSHAQQVSTDNLPMLNIEIEKFIRENPDNVVSTLLLLFDYGDLSNTENTDSLLHTISEDAKPLFLLQTYQSLRNARNKQQAQYFYMIDLIESSGKWSSIKNVAKGYNLIWLWSRDDPQRYATVSSLKNLAASFGNRLTVTDICVDGDTIAWHATLTNDSTRWAHYWAPGGPEGKYLNLLATYSTPAFVVADSTSTFIYRGTNLAEAEKAIKGKNRKH